MSGKLSDVRDAPTLNDISEGQQGPDGGRSQRLAVPVSRRSVAEEGGSGRGIGGSRRRLIWMGAILGALLLAVMTFRPTPMIVEAGEVVQGPLEITIDAEGVTRIVDRYQIGAPVSGRLQRIEAREGDRVNQGDILARLVSVPLDPRAVAQARAAVATAEARVAEANVRVLQTGDAAEQVARTTARVREVAELGGISVDATERAELELSSAEREHQAARSRADAARNELGAARAALMEVDPEVGPGQAGISLRAPTSGRVLRVIERSERIVPAGTPLLEVGDADHLEVVVDVLSTDAVRIQPGAPIRLEQWGGDLPLEGTVRVVEPSAFTRVSALGVEEQRVNIIADIAAPPPALGDGYRVDARIVIWSAPDAVKVPSSALFRDDAAWAVFVIEDGRAQQRRVEIGQRGIAEAEVLSGLRYGDRVVLFPSDQLRNGTRVAADL
jgi:HlyD family secretion protein